MNQQRIARHLTRAGLVLWAAPLLLLVGVLVPSVRPIINPPVADATVFTLSWGFLLATPILAVSAWRLAERDSATRKLAIIQTSIWFFAVMMTLAIGF